MKMEGLSTKVIGFTGLVLAAGFLAGCGGSDEESSIRSSSAVESAQVKETESNMMGEMKDAGAGALGTAGEIAGETFDAAKEMVGDTVGEMAGDTLDAAKGMAGEASQTVSEKANELMGGMMPGMDGNLSEETAAEVEEKAEESEELDAIKSLKGML